jgi:hypothetical protein
MWKNMETLEGMATFGLLKTETQTPVPGRASPTARTSGIITYFGTF